MEVKYLATITIPDEGWDVNQLEEVCWEAGQKAGRVLFLQALRQVEEKVLAQDLGEKKGKVRYYLTTRLGAITFYRQKVKQEVEGKARYSCPLDKAMGLELYQETTLWVKRRACELAVDHTYREAARLLSQEGGTEMSHRALHRSRPAAGQKLEAGGGQTLGGSI